MIKNILLSSGQTVTLATGQTYDLKDNEVMINGNIYRKSDLEISVYGNSATSSLNDVLIGIRKRDGRKNLPADLVLYNEWSVDGVQQASLADALENIQTAIYYDPSTGGGFLYDLQDNITLNKTFSLTENGGVKTTIDLSGFVTLADLYGQTVILEVDYYWLVDYTYKVTRVKWLEDGLLNELFLDQNLVFIAADPDNNRIDAAVINIDTDTVYKVDGTAEPQPSNPPILENELLLFHVFVSAATTEPVGVTNTVLYDENLQEVGGEADTSASHVSITFNSIADPFRNATNILFNATPNNEYADFIFSTEQNISDYDKLLLRVKNIDTGSRLFAISLRDAAGNLMTGTSVFVITAGTLGFNGSNVTDYQELNVPVTYFNASGVSPFYRLRVQNRRAGGSYYADAIEFQEGTPVTPPQTITPPVQNFNNPYPDTAALFADQSNQKAGWLQEVTDGSGFTGITSGIVWAKYKGTTAGTEADYSWEPRATSSSPISTINVSDYGGIADAIAKSDGSVTSGLATLNSASGEFVVGDVGKVIFIGDGAGGSSLPLVTTILAYVSATQVTLSANAGATVSNAYYIYGTDNTVAFQDALDAAFVIGSEYGKASVQCEIGTYLINGAVGTNGNGENAQIKWPFTSISDDAINIELLGETTAGIPRIHWDEKGKHGTVIQSTKISQTFSAATGLPSVIGSASSYGIQHGGGWAGFNYVGMIIKDVTIRQADNPWLTGIDAGWVHQCSFERIMVDTVITGLNAAVPTHPASIGVQFPIVNCRGPITPNNITVKGYYCAFGLGELMNGSRLEGLLCNMLVALTPAYHANYIDFLEDINCIHGFGGLNPATGIIDPPITYSWLPSATNLGTGVHISLWSIQDNNGQVSGFNRIDHIRDINSTSKLVGYFTLVTAGGTRVSTGLILNGGTNHHLEDLFLKSFDTSLSPPIFLNISHFELLSGSPSKSLQNGFPVWLFDAASIEAISLFMKLPSDWDAYNIYIYWTNNGAGSGDVVWRHDRKNINDTESLAISTTTGALKIETAPAQDILKTTLLEENVLKAKTLNLIQILRIADNVADTLANDASLLGVMLEAGVSLIPIDNIFSYWNLDSDYNDQIGTNHGTPTSMSLVSSGGIGNVADFTAGTSSQISVADDNTLSFGNSTNDFEHSFILAIKFNVVGNAMFIDKRDGAGNSKEYSFYYDHGVTQFVIRYFDQSSGGYIQKAYTITPSTGVWYHFVITKDITNSHTGIKMYLDGVSVGTGSVSGIYTAMENGTAPVLFGKLASGTTFSLDGYMDEIAILDKEASSGEALAIFNKYQSGQYLTE